MSMTKKIGVRLTRKKYTKHIALLSMIMVCLVCSFLVLEKRNNTPVHADVLWNTDVDSDGKSDWLSNFNYTTDTTDPDNPIITITGMISTTLPNPIVHMYGSANLDDGNTYHVKLKASGTSLFRTSNIVEFYGHDLDVSEVTTLNNMFDSCTSLTTVNFGSWATTSSLTNMSVMFWGCTNLNSVTFPNTFNTEGVTNFSQMFQRCSGLTEVNISMFETKNVTNTSYMFNDCTNLVSITFPSSSTSDNGKLFILLENMKEMFASCTSLTQLDLRNFDMQAITTANGAFYNCSMLTDLKFPTDHVIMKSAATIQTLFHSCSSLEYLDLSGFQLDAATSLNSFFYGCSKLREVDFGEHFGCGQVTDFTSFFNGCNDLEYVDFGPGFITLPTCTSFSAMFWGNSKLKSVNLGGLDLSAVDCMSVDVLNKLNNKQYLETVDLSGVKISPATSTTLSGLFENCSSLKTVKFDKDNFDMSGITDMSKMFSGCIALEEMDLSEFNVTSSLTNLSEMFKNCSSMTEIHFGTSFNATGVTNCDKMFYDCAALETLDMDGFTTSPALVSASNMFTNTNAIKWVDLGKLDLTSVPYYQDSSSYTINLFRYKDYLEYADLSEVTISPSTTKDLSEMFASCENLETVIFGPNFDTSGVTNFHNMFFYDEKLESLNLSNFELSTSSSDKIDLSGMFAFCRSLSSLEIDETKFNTIRVTNMGNLFNDCDKLTTLPISSFNTSNVTNMSEMFSNLDFTEFTIPSNFDTSKVTNMQSMFSHCENLITLDVSDLETDSVTDVRSMFNFCKALNFLDLSNFDLTNVTQADNIFCNTGYNAESFTLKTPKNMSSDLTNTGFTKTYAILDGVMFDENGVSYTKVPNVTESITLYSDLVLWTDPDTSKEYHVKDNNYYKAVGDPWGSPNVGIFGFEDGTSIIYGKGKTYDCDNNTNFSVFSSYLPDSTKKLVVVTPTPTDKIIINTYGFMNCKNNLEEIINMDKLTLQGTSMDQMFYCDMNLKNIDTSLLNTTGITSMQGMFEYCEKITNLDVSHFDTSNVTDMADMFEQCKVLKSIDVSHFDTSHVTRFNNMFATCKSLTSLNLSNFDVSSSTNLSMFCADCFNLENLDISFDASTITNMSEIIANDTKLKTLKVPTHVKDTINEPLPIKMYDIDGNEYDKFPTGLETSITLYAENPKKPEPPSGGGGSSEKPSSTQTITVGGSTSVNPYMTGYTSILGKRTFKPNNNITRAEVATILSRLSSNFIETNDYKSYNSIYSDIKNNDAWYANSLGFATKSSVMEGYDGAFYPNENMTRAQFVTAICRFKNINLSAGLNIETNLTDIKGRWFENYARALSALGYIKGYNDNTFRGDSPITRAEACAIINRVMNINVNENKENVYTDVFENDWYYKDVISSSME